MKLNLLFSHALFISLLFYNGILIMFQFYAGSEHTLKPDVMSTSFGYYSNYIYSNWLNDLNMIYSYLVQTADEGITVVAASGDGGYSSSGQISVVATDPFAIAVGEVSVSL